MTNFTKSFLSAVILLSVISFPVKAQNPVPNASFENWSSGAPVGWSNYNLLHDTTLITQVTPGYNSTYAAKGQTYISGGDTIAPFLTTIETGVGFPITQNYDSLNFYYKSHLLNNDTFKVAVELLTASGNPIAASVDYITADNLAFTVDNLLFYYFYQDSTAASAIILFYLSNANATNPASYFIVDDVSLTGPFSAGGCNLIVSANVTNATCDTCHDGQATAEVLNGTPNYTYTWYTAPLQTTQTATGLAAGTYTVCVTDGNGCSACNYSVFVDSTNCNGFAIIANATNASCTNCADGKISISIMNGAPPYTYNWIPFGSGPGIDSTLTTGFYQICVADLYGCVACDTATVGVGACSAYFNLYPDSVAHQYTAVNNAFGAGTLTYVWSWGDGSANDSTAYPSHTYATAGFYTICLTITDTAGCTNTYCNSFYLLRTTNTMIHVNVVPPIVTGVNEISSNATMYIFPNPASDYFTLFVPENSINGRLKIYNLLGELIYTSTVVKQETNIDVSALAKGIYVLEVSNGDNISRKKFIRE